MFLRARRAVFHQAAGHHQIRPGQIADGRRRVEPSLLANGEEGVPHGWAGPHPGDSDAGQIKAQDPADGTIRDHRHRSAHQLPPAMGGNREFSQRFHLRLDAQGSVFGDLQISREIHQQCRVDGITLLIVPPASK